MDFLSNRKAKHIGGPSGKMSRIRVNMPRSGDFTCMQNLSNFGRKSDELKTKVGFPKKVYCACFGVLI